MSRMGGDHGRILALVRSVRRRWRLRLALRGLAWAGGITLMVLVLSALTLERMRFTPEAVAWLRVLTWSTLVASLAFFVVRPLLRRVTDRQVALYLEEHEPSLDLAVVSALEAGERHDVSPGLTRRLVASALERAHSVDDGRQVDQSGLYRAAGALIAVVVVALVVDTVASPPLRHGLSALLNPSADPASVNPYSVSVLPGDVTIARGTDQMVTARLGGFDAPDASIFLRTGPDASFQRLSMIPAEGGFEMLLLNVGERTEYFVESTGIRSPTYAIDVADLPYVDGMQLTYVFPAYTGLPPRVVEDGGDVVALPGTVVELRVTPTIPAPAGRLRMDGEPASELTVQDNGELLGRFTVEREGYYSVDLARDDGTLVEASPEYAIDVLDDMPPSVRLNRPGRDTPASAIEEVYVEVGASDDYGIGDVRLVLSVNGGPEDTLTLFEGRGAPLPDVSAGHTLFLEEYPLEPGDLVAYYALVRDNRNRRGGDAVSSDIYFLNIRPFERAYRQGEQQGGGPPQGGEQGGAETALSELQRQVIAATFNLIRQRDAYGADEFSENVVSVALAQARLREQVQTLLQRMANRGIMDSDPAFRDVSAILPKAAEAMEAAKARLDAEELREAMPHEQSALRFLQQAEETYERYLVQQQQGGGGGGGQQANVDDLADLFELELDKLRNQYETVQRGQQQSADETVDELMERLQELARRQEQEAERQRRRAQQGAQGSQGGSQSQRALAEEVEEAARELQRLAREQDSRELEDAARRLQEAAENMRRAATRQGAGGQADSQAALDRLEEARRRLRENRADRARRDADDALRRVDDLVRQQRDVRAQVRELPTGGAERQRRIQNLRERKDQMTEAVRALEGHLDEAAAGAQADHPQAARDLRAAAEEIRESKLKETLQYSKGTISEWDPRSAETLEMNIEAALAGLRERVEAARGAVGEPRVNPLAEALDETRELVRGMEGMDRRLRESTGQEQGPPSEGAQGRPGEEAQGEAGDRQSSEGQAGGRPGEGTPQEGTPRDASNARPGDAPPSGGPTAGAPRLLSEEERRQYAREFGQRADQVRGLRDQLREAGRPVEELQAVLDALARLEREGVYDNPAVAAGLNQEILDMLKRLEFGLRREVEGEAERRATLSGSDEVPAGYRKLVEEYYKALARSGRGGR